jgi:NADPH-dependent ferric siderophore reductase
VTDGPTRVRREPPPLLPVEVRRVEARTPRLERVTLGGPALASFEPGLPGGSVRLLLPRHGSDLVLPTWQGNDYRDPDGNRPTIRTLTPLRFDAADLELDVEVVLHGEGPLSAWAASAGPGAPAAVSGPGRGYHIDPSARSFLLAGDESALPAIGLLTAAMPAGATVRVIVEVADVSARLDLPSPAAVEATWLGPSGDASPGDALVAAVTSASLDADERLWVAGEAAAMQRIRRHLFETCGIARSRAVVRGYWKHGRAGGDDLE